MTTLLIVDDHPSFRASARALLQSEGFEVVGEAVDGAEALEAARKLHPDVVLLDIQLPDMSGFDLCERLSANGGAPVIVLVSSHEASDFGPCIDRSSAAGFVTKGELSGAAVAALLP